MCRGLAALPASCLERFNSCRDMKDTRVYKWVHSQVQAERSKQIFREKDQKVPDVPKAKEFKTRLGFLLHIPEFGHKIGNLSWGTKQKYSLEEALGWKESFDQLLRSRSGMAVFHGFLKMEFSEENLEFWLACEEYKKIPSKAKLAAKANRIFEDFVQTEAPREVNLDHETREVTRRNLTVATSTCFEEAQAKTYLLMEKDSYPRFLKSAYYRDLIEQATGHRTGKPAHT